jgi:glycosyltransferase involved in cell wall biosynthesis
VRGYDRQSRAAEERLTLAVVVPTYRRPESLERCVRALVAQHVPADRIVVVVREGDEETATVVARLQAEPMAFERATVRAPGQVAAIAAGVACCDEDVVAHTDDDAVPHADWLERLLSHYGPDVGGVGGRDVIHPLKDPRPESTVVGRVGWFGRLIGNHHAGVGTARDVDVLKGVNMSLRRDLWRLDARLRGEGAQIHMEVDLCLRAKRDGWRLVYDPEAQVDHYPARRFDADDRSQPTHGARANVEFNYAYVLAKHLPPWRLPVAAAYILGAGTRWAPGLIAWLERGIRQPGSFASATGLFVALTSARIRGLASGARHRL